MGCVQSMQDNFNHAEIDKPPPPSDPRSPLTVKQTFLIKASWKGIFREIQQTGILLFIKLFEDNEELLDLFEKFETIKTKEALRHSEELAEHANKVMETLNEGIKNLGDIDNFLAFIRHVGATHHQVPGFKAENFWKVEQPFLEAAKTTLGDRYTPNVENLYILTIRFILENLVKGYEESGNETTQKSEET